MNTLINLNLFIVGLVISSIIILACVIYFSNRKSSTSYTFLFFSLVTSFWGIVNYLNGQSISLFWAFWIVRLVMFSAVWQAFFIFQLFYVFPETTFLYKKWYKFGLLPCTALVSLLTLTPMVFSHVSKVSAEGRIVNIENGPLIGIFGIFSVGLVMFALFSLLKKIWYSKNTEKGSLRLILWGTLMTFVLIIIFNFIFPAFLNNSSFVPFGAIFVIPFVFFTGYSIIKHNFLNIKIISTELLAFILSVAILLEVVMSNDLVTVIFRSSLFLLVLSVGIWLIKSVIMEVKQREQLEILYKELQSVNIRLQDLDKQKTEFLSIASHQLRTPLSILKGYIELIKDGAYGKASKELLGTLDNMDMSNERLIKLVDEFLDVSRIEQGRTKFVFHDYDMVELIKGVVTELSARAKDKGLSLKWKPEFKKLSINMDDEKVRHVIFNFVDNAIKYTEKGEIKITVEQGEEGVEVKVNDKGLGFDKKDEVSFFTKFYRGENVKDINVTGTGLGLFVCKKFIETHGGKVWAKSPGLGKGSEFGFWIPLKPSAEVLLSMEKVENKEVAVVK